MRKNDKTPKTKTTDSGRETRVLLEDIRQQVKIVAEGHGTIIKKLEDHDKRLDNIESDLTGVKTDLEVVKTVVMDTSQRVKTIEKKIDNHEVRITKLEEKVLA